MSVFLTGGNGTVFYQKGTGTGTVDDPFIPHLTVPYTFLANEPTPLNDGDTAIPRCDAQQVQLSNPGVTQTVFTQTSVTVSHTTSTLLVAADANRTFTPLIQNPDSANPIYINVAGGAGVADATCYKVAAGETFPKSGMLPIPPTNAWYALAGIADVTVNVITG